MAAQGQNDAQEEREHKPHEWEDQAAFFEVPERNKGTGGYPAPWIEGGQDAYKKQWEESVGDKGDEWWRKASCFYSLLQDIQSSRLPLYYNFTAFTRHTQTAQEHLYWHRPFQTVRSGSFKNADTQWL